MEEFEIGETVTDIDGSYAKVLRKYTWDKTVGATYRLRRSEDGKVTWRTAAELYSVVSD